MDGADVPQDVFAACMDDLARVNTLTLARRPTLAFIDAELRALPPDGTLTVLDVGFGSGDMLRAIRHRAEQQGRQNPQIRLIGIDLNPRSAPVARQLTSPDMQIEFHTGDVFAWPEDQPVDLVISSLVTHHMQDDEIIRFLGWMEHNAQAGWLVNDLHRHRLPYHGFRWLARLMRWHGFVQHDGPLSIARAFRRDDWRALLQNAQLESVAAIRWWFPFRYCVERRKW